MRLFSLPSYFLELYENKLNKNKLFANGEFKGELFPMQSTAHLFKLAFTAQNNAVLSAGHSMALFYFFEKAFFCQSHEDVVLRDIQFIFQFKVISDK